MRMGAVHASPLPKTENRTPKTAPRHSVVERLASETRATFITAVAALCDCHEAGQTFAFARVILDCVDDRAKAFYQRLDFAELPGNPFTPLGCGTFCDAELSRGKGFTGESIERRARWTLLPAKSIPGPTISPLSRVL